MTASAEACSRIWFVEFELDAVFAEATDISPIYIELVCLNLTQRQSVIPVLTHVPLRILRWMILIRWVGLYVSVSGSALLALEPIYLRYCFILLCYPREPAPTPHFFPRWLATILPIVQGHKIEALGLRSLRLPLEVSRHCCCLITVLFYVQKKVAGNARYLRVQHILTCEGSVVSNAESEVVLALQDVLKINGRHALPDAFSPHDRRIALFLKSLMMRSIR